jgi:hypothetical protein
LFCSGQQLPDGESVHAAEYGCTDVIDSRVDKKTVRLDETQIDRRAGAVTAGGVKGAEAARADILFTDNFITESSVSDQRYNRSQRQK